MKRIEFLDGYRGFALILIIFYHAFYRWSDVVPYANSYSEFPLFKYGYLGINLFLLISGFVILLTLEKSKNIRSFIFNRWKRLFPAMLIATILIYVTAQFLIERPRGMPFLRDVVPGLFFIEPAWLKAIFGVPLKSLEGSFWSIFVEVKFYVIFALLYFYLGRSKAIVALLFMYFSAVIISFIPNVPLNKIVTGLSFQYFCWFAAGCYAYIYFTSKKLKYLLFCVAICSFDIVLHEFFALGRLIAAFIILAVFILPIYYEKLQGIFSNKFLLFLGFISYPFYLIHENAMIAMIIKLDNLFDGAIPNFILPFIPISVLALIAYIIAKYIEPILKNSIDKVVSRSNH